MLNGKTILVTGGIGSFGKNFIKTVFEKYPIVTIRLDKGINTKLKNLTSGIKVVV